MSQKKRQAPSQRPVAQSQVVHSAPEVKMRALSNDNASNSMRRVSTSPTQPGSWNHSSIPQDPSTLRNQLVTGIEPNYRRDSQDLYLSPNTNSAERQTGNSPRSSLPSSASQPSFPMQNVLPGHGIHDLSAMMFPSTDPFAYPNQPMTTLESQNLVKQENPLDSNMYNQPSTSTPYGNLEAQMYDSTLQFAPQGQQPNFGMQNMPPMRMSNADPTATTISMQGREGSGWQQQQQSRPQRSGGTPGMNLDQLFGEDWGGWMNQGYDRN